MENILFTFVFVKYVMYEKYSRKSNAYCFDDFWNMCDQSDFQSW